MPPHTVVVRVAGTHDAPPLPPGPPPLRRRRRRRCGRLAPPTSNVAGFVGRWSGVVGPRGSHTWSGTALDRRWAPRWSTRCSLPPRTG